MNNALYQVDGGGRAAFSDGPGGGADDAHLSLRRERARCGEDFRFDSSYVIGVETEVKHNGAPVRALVEWPVGLGDMEEFLPSSSTRSTVRTSAASLVRLVAGRQAGFDRRKEVERQRDASIAPYSYAAVMDLYFAAAFLPDNPSGTTVVTLHNAIDVPGNLSDPNSAENSGGRDWPGGGRHQRRHAVCAFLQDPRRPTFWHRSTRSGADGKANGQSLEPLIQFGWMTVIAKPLYIVLRFMVDHGIGNWGWAIIVFTIIFSLVMLPTRFMMMKSSLKMMRIQPKVEHQAALCAPESQRPQAV